MPNRARETATKTALLTGFIGFEGQCSFKYVPGFRSNLDSNVRPVFLTRQIAGQSRQCVSRLHLGLTLR